MNKVSEERAPEVDLIFGVYEAMSSLDLFVDRIMIENPRCIHENTLSRAVVRRWKRLYDDLLNLLPYWEIRYGFPNGGFYVPPYCYCKEQREGRE